MALLEDDLVSFAYMLFCPSHKSCMVCRTCFSVLHANLVSFAVQAFLSFTQILYRLPHMLFCPSRKSCIIATYAFLSFTQILYRLLYMLFCPHTNLVSLAVCAFVCIILRQSKTGVFPSIFLFAYIHGTIRNSEGV